MVTEGELAGTDAAAALLRAATEARARGAPLDTASRTVRH